jgi:hypothetical protein
VQEGGGALGVATGAVDEPPPRRLEVDRELDE